MIEEEGKFTTDSEDKLLISLEVIGVLNVGDKLFWDNNGTTVNIQHCGPLLPFRRIISGQNRNDSISCLQKLISHCIKLLKDQTENTRLKNALIKATNGLSNLKKTYDDDKQISSSISILSQDILEIIK